MLHGLITFIAYSMLFFSINISAASTAKKTKNHKQPKTQAAAIKKAFAAKPALKTQDFGEALRLHDDFAEEIAERDLKYQRCGKASGMQTPGVTVLDQKDGKAEAYVRPEAYIRAERRKKFTEPTQREAVDLEDHEDMSDRAFEERHKWRRDAERATNKKLIAQIEQQEKARALLKAQIERDAKEWLQCSDCEKWHPLPDKLLELAQDLVADPDWCCQDNWWAEDYDPEADICDNEKIIFEQLS